MESIIRRAVGAQGNKKESQHSCQDIESDWVGLQCLGMETGRGGSVRSTDLSPRAPDGVSRLEPKTGNCTRDIWLEIQIQMVY